MIIRTVTAMRILVPESNTPIKSDGTGSMPRTAPPSAVAVGMTLEFFIHRNLAVALMYINARREREKG